MTAVGTSCCIRIVTMNVDMNYKSQGVGYAALDFALCEDPNSQVAKWLVQRGATSGVEAQ